MTVIKSAQLSPCRHYRYALWRVWDPQRPVVLFVGLNPSTADECHDDATLIKCQHYAISWGYGGVCMANLFAYRARDPRQLRLVNDPVGINNDEWLIKLAAEAEKTIACWGNHGQYLQRDQQVMALLPSLYCLRRNQSGAPSHPLYLTADLLPQQLI